MFDWWIERWKSTLKKLGWSLIWHHLRKGRELGGFMMTLCLDLIFGYRKLEKSLNQVNLLHHWKGVVIAVVINQQFNQLRLKEPINHPLGGVVSLDVVFIHKNFNLLFSDYLFRIEPKFNRLANFRLENSRIQTQVSVGRPWSFYNTRTLAGRSVTILRQCSLILSFWLCPSL